MRFPGVLNAVWRDTRGGAAIIAAVALPVVATLAVGAIDLTSVIADRQRAQQVADSAALAAAKQLSLASTKGVEQQANNLVDAGLGDIKGRFAYTASTKAEQDLSSVTVRVEGRRLSLFGNMLPPGGWRIAVSATASAVGRVPLCVLVSGAAAADDLEMRDRGQLTAGGCMVHANGNITVTDAALLQADTVQAAGRATGRITPAPQQSGPVIDDPFAAIKVATPKSLCLPVDVLLAAGLRVLTPGVHCGNYRAAKGATLRLSPGDHYFIGKLELSENAILKGDNVALVFDKNSQFSFREQAQIDLTGRTSGPFAGFVIATTRDNTSTFDISSDSARRLLGTVYIPAATLQVTGQGSRIADQSPWTVIVAKSIKLAGSPNLVINSRYAGSGVPVPKGVGPSANSVALKQ